MGVKFFFSEGIKGLKIPIDAVHNGQTDAEVMNHIFPQQLKLMYMFVCMCNVHPVLGCRSRT